MRGTADEIDFAIAQCRIGTIGREYQLSRYRDPFAGEKSELGCREGWEIRV